MDVNFYRPDCLKDEFVLEKGFAVKIESCDSFQKYELIMDVNFVDLEQIKLCLKDEFARGDRLLFEDP